MIDYNQQQEAQEAKARIYKQIATFVVVFAIVGVGVYFVHKYGTTDLLHHIPVIKDFIKQ